MNSLQQIEQEYIKCSEKFPLFNTPHEGYAVLLEEVDELWDAVKIVKYPVSVHDIERMKKEVIQIGAMAVKFIESFENFKHWNLKKSQT
jgi:NTP pyrophosphatase (non-canonical NTP hydrolase)